MMFKRRVLAASGSALLLGATLLGSAGISAAQADSPGTVTGETTRTPCTITYPSDPNAAPTVSGPGCPALPSTGTPQTVTAPVASGSVIWYPVQAVQVSPVSQTGFLALVAQQLGVSQYGLTLAFQRAESVVTFQTQAVAGQDLLLDVVAQQLGVSRTTLNLALQQAATTEVNLLAQYGLISWVQASAYDAAIAYGQYGLGLGFGIPGFSAPAL